MIEDVKEIASKFNINSIVQAYNNQYQIEMKTNKPYEGKLVMIIFNRKISDQILKILGINYINFLHGWLPNHSKKITNYDFLLSPDFIVTKITANIWLKPIIQQINVIEILVEKLPNSELMQTSIIL